MPQPGRRKVVALLTNDAGLGVDYQGDLRRGVERECVARDLDLVVYAGRTDYSPSDAQRRIFRLLHPGRIDGIVLAAGCIAAFADLESVLGSIVEVGIPTVSVGQISAGMPGILIANERGAELMVDHLVMAHGRRRIACIAGPLGHEESDQRLAGTRAELARHGLELRPDALVRGNFSLASGASAARELLARGIPFDALVVASDDMALGALDALRAAGIRCPQDVSLAGFDDAPSARFAELPLTTIRQPISTLGAAAVGTLASLWEAGEVAATKTLETEIILRESCGCLPLTAHRAALADRELSPEGGRQELVRLLRPLVDGDLRRRHWADELQAAVADEQKGFAGTLTRTLETLAHEISDLQPPIHELQPVITSLRNWSPPGDDALEEAFHAARVAIGALASRLVGEHVMRGELVLEEIRLCWERLATSLTRPALKHELTAGLPRLAIKNALISLHDQGEPEWLVPLVHLSGGFPVELPERRYPAKLLFPDGAFEHQERQTLLVLPLTFEAETLGVAVLDLPRPLEIYTLLREQIGSAIKAVQLHQEVLYQERLHALAEEEERVTGERLRSLALIAGGVAHDLNNVLGPVVALPEAILEELRQAAGSRYSLPPAVLEDLETIRQAGQRAAVTIRDLLALGRPREAPDSTVDLNRLVENERQTFASLCERCPQVELRLETSRRRLFVRASKPHLVRAISNLVINASDAIEGAGSITLRLGERELTTPLEGLERVEPGRYALVEVDDTGSGIAAEHLPRIMEPFYTTRRGHRRSGTGLGLAIVQRIVKDSMGFVQVHSELGRGTRFTLFFPQETATVAASTIPPPPSLGGRERILVVDDEPVQLRTSRRILERLGYVVATASSGEEALALLGETAEGDDFDLLLVDMVMAGGIDGLTTVDGVRRSRPSQRVLMVSGYAPEHVDGEADRPGLMWLAKPYDMATLAGAVRAALRRSSLPARPNA